MSRERLFEMQGPRRTLPIGFLDKDRAHCDLPGACNDNQRQAPAGFWIAVSAVLSFICGATFFLVRAI